jgi:hypothetical protein
MSNGVEEVESAVQSAGQCTGQSTGQSTHRGADTCGFRDSILCRGVVAHTLYYLW